MEMAKGRGNAEGISNMDKVLRYLPIPQDIMRMATGNSADTLRMWDARTQRKSPKKNRNQRRLRDSVDLIPPISPQILSQDRVLQPETLKGLCLESGYITADERLDAVATLEERGNVSSDESGQPGAMQSAEADAALNEWLWFETMQRINARLGVCTQSVARPPLTNAPHNGTSVVRQDTTQGWHNGAAEAAISLHTDLECAEASTNSEERPGSRSRNPWRYDKPTAGQAATNLISVAIVLEEQAQSLRWLASRRDSRSSGHNQQQTTAFPLHCETGMSLRRQGAVDESAVLMPDRTPRGGLTPTVSDYHSSWDVGPDLSAAFGYQKTLCEFQQILQPTTGQEIDHTAPCWQFASNPDDQSIDKRSLIRTLQQAAPILAAEEQVNGTYTNCTTSVTPKMHSVRTLDKTYSWTQ